MHSASVVARDTRTALPLGFMAMVNVLLERLTENCPAAGVVLSVIAVWRTPSIQH